MTRWWGSELHEARWLSSALCERVVTSALDEVGDLPALQQCPHVLRQQGLGVDGAAASCVGADDDVGCLPQRGVRRKGLDGGHVERGTGQLTLGQGLQQRVLVDVNRRICEMTGYHADELIGRNARMLYPSRADYEFVGDEKYSMGNVWDGVTNTALRDEFKMCNAYARPDCKDCWAKLYCSGGCAANAYHAAGDIHGTYQMGCEIFKKRIECALMIKVAEAMDKQ